jgi:hypothetical protein
LFNVCSVGEDWRVIYRKELVENGSLTKELEPVVEEYKNSDFYFPFLYSVPVSKNLDLFPSYIFNPPSTPMSVFTPSVAGRSPPSNLFRPFNVLTNETEISEWKNSLEVGDEVREILINLIGWKKKNNDFSVHKNHFCRLIIDKSLLELKWYIQRMELKIKKEKNTQENIILSSNTVNVMSLYSVPLPLIRRRVENVLSILLLMIYKYHTIIHPLQKK